MKKEYIMPTMRIVELRHKAHLLAGSGSAPDGYGGRKYKINNDEINDDHSVI